MGAPKALFSGSLLFEIYDSLHPVPYHICQQPLDVLFMHPSYPSSNFCQPGGISGKQQKGYPDPQFTGGETKLREKGLAQGHTVAAWLSWDWPQDL